MPIRLRQAGCGLILILMLITLFGGGAQPEAAGLIPPPWDKLAHLLVFAGFGGLLHWGLGFSRMWAVVLVLLIGGADELHQATLPGRFAGIDDWLADFAGALLGVWLAGLLPRK